MVSRVRVAPRKSLDSEPKFLACGKLIPRCVGTHVLGNTKNTSPIITRYKIQKANNCVAGPGNSTGPPGASPGARASAAQSITTLFMFVSDLLLRTPPTKQKKNGRRLDPAHPLPSFPATFAYQLLSTPTYRCQHSGFDCQNLALATASRGYVCGAC